MKTIIKDKGKSVNVEAVSRMLSQCSFQPECTAEHHLWLTSCFPFQFHWEPKRYWGRSLGNAASISAQKQDKKGFPVNAVQTQGFPASHQ